MGQVYLWAGEPIYRIDTALDLEHNEWVLLSKGYRESSRKPKLFYRSDLGVVFFADMRGTDYVPVWQDTSPLFYVGQCDIPRWRLSRIASQEFSRLGCCRLPTMSDDTYYCIDAPDLGHYALGLGYCVHCGKDIESDDDYCSPECAEASRLASMAHCVVCNKPIEGTGLVFHHTNYAKDETVDVCRSCHLRIHRGTDLTQWKPVDKKQTTLFWRGQ